MIVTKRFPAAGLADWRCLAAWYPQRIVTEIIDGPVGAGWRWLPAWYLQTIMTKIIAGGWLG